jgi:endo-1,4-beta-D-glucanase Y
MSQLGRLLRNNGRRVMPIESFGYGFMFAFAMALVRFLMLR